MVLNNIKDDFDSLRGRRSYASIANDLGIAKQSLARGLTRDAVVAREITRFFEAIGYDIVLTFVPKDAAPDATMYVSDSSTEKMIYRIRRGNVEVDFPNDNSYIVSSHDVKDLVEAKGYDLTMLPLIGEFDTYPKANSVYQSQKKNLVLHSTLPGNRTITADVVAITEVSDAGRETVQRFWAGKIHRARSYSRNTL